MAALRLTPLASVDGRRVPLLSSRSAIPPQPPPPYPLLLLFVSLPGSVNAGLAWPGCCRKEGTVEVQASEGEGQERVQQQDASPEDLEYVAQIKNASAARSSPSLSIRLICLVLELLKKNRDMIFGEVKLTLMIEDPRELERKRLLGIDTDEVTRDDLVSALVDFQNRLALRLLAEEMLQWPNLEVEAPKKGSRKSLYAKATDTGIDPKEAAKRLNIDWDSAADIESEDDDTEDAPVPPVVGYGALYLVTALPVIIGASVVLILFYNSLQ
ncbi:unnamed protein product [Spirodela intermedia]|uniref:Uncharacterized protein n=1 Tax=Spirodela intermedia TaxID=51605 RepID=A0A7I8IUR8_SPIIN|nr:unnamed protein product [Spirodela intermedia]CAA6661291.1 unnamed protein product [Spirodela intermedia]